MGVPATVAVLLAMLALLIAAEYVRPVRTFEEVPGWKLKCLAFIPLVVGVSASIPYLMAGLIDGITLLPGDRLGTIVGTIVGIVVSELIVYWVHRLHHSVSFL